jgi:hypothetical protein
MSDNELFKKVFGNIENSLGIMPKKDYDIIDPIASPPSQQKTEDLADQIKKIWGGMINGPKLQLNSIYQELNSMIVLRNHLQSVVNGAVPRTITGIGFLVVKDEEAKLRKLISKLDYEIISRSLSALEVYEKEE